MKGDVLFLAYFSMVFNMISKSSSLRSQEKSFLSLNNKSLERIKNSLPKDSNSTIPILNVKVEEPDREPSSLKLYNRERQLERNRLRDLESSLSSQKRRFQQVIIMQNLQIAALSNIAQANLKMLNSIKNKTFMKASSN
mmetsp:Transcript_9018/g.9365  ORF Transcript_9018/g.9365 Transcript_9018/m.9365 type:complete len:139 (+) Transcript_9018:2-418(+)